jgi:hypothetical protein
MFSACKVIEVGVEIIMKTAASVMRGQETKQGHRGIVGGAGMGADRLGGHLGDGAEDLCG